MLVSIIIPVPKINEYIRESIPHILALLYRDFEIIILPDDPSEEQFPKTKIISTGKVGPAEKRDMALVHAHGEILAFLDDDAYPDKDWLTNAVHHFENSDVGAVGGPAITPPQDSLLQQASGAVFESWLGGGGCTLRYAAKEAREVDDWPTVNLLVRRSVFEQVGGFDNTFWPGEDTKLCLDITKKLRKKIMYEPRAAVWHHRRSLFMSHGQQVWRYGFHRGYFVKVLPETSARSQYFVPSLWVLFLFGGAVASYFIPWMRDWYYAIIGLYTCVLIGTAAHIAWKKQSTIMGILSLCGIAMTHVVYGVAFVKGLCAHGLKR